MSVYKISFSMVLLVVSWGAPCVLAGSGLSSSKPNILVILLDDFGTGHFAPIAREIELKDVDPGFIEYTAELEEAYDPQVALEASRRAMPFMDTLVEQGVIFSRAFAASSLCAPSRQGFLTGTNPTRWGAYRNIDINICGLPEGRSLVNDLQAAGYRTGFVGKWHLGARDHGLRDEVLEAGGSEGDVVASGYWGSVRESDHPLNHGFDYALFYNLWECPFYDSQLIWENRRYTGKQAEYNTDLFTNKAIDFIEESVGDGRPFFVQLALHAVHIPLDVPAPEKYAKRFNTGYESIDMFYSHVYGVDQSIRRIVEMLEACGEWENTILFFASDNGATCKVGEGDLSLIPGNSAFRGHKGQYYQGGLRVPLVMVWPSKIWGPIHVEQAVSLMDVLPTALSAGGVDVPEDIDGKSLLPVVMDGAVELDRQLFFTGIHAPAWGYSGEGVIGNAQARRDLSPGASVVIEGDWLLRYVGALDAGLMRAEAEGRPGYYALFNIKADPLEQNDLYQMYPEVADRLKRSYAKHAEMLPAPHAWDRKRWAELVLQSEIDEHQVIRGNMGGESE